MVFKKRPVAKRRRVPKRRIARKSTAMTATKVRSIALKAVEKTREIKRLWGKIVLTASNNLVQVPTGTNVPQFIFSDGTNSYSTTCLNKTIQGLENENRLGNVIQPKRFTLKGYGVIGNTTSSNTAIYETHVRLVVGFRRQSSILTPSNGNLMLEGGVTSPLNFDYTDILNGFNWKEFRPFYDKTYKICPMTRDANIQITNPFTKNYFQFNVSHKFGSNEQLVSLEDISGATDELYNNKNIYAIFIARQMNNDNDVVTSVPVEVYATSLFEFHDA